MCRCFSRSRSWTIACWSACITSSRRSASCRTNAQPATPSRAAPASAPALRASSVLALLLLPVLVLVLSRRRRRSCTRGSTCPSRSRPRPPDSKWARTTRTLIRIRALQLCRSRRRPRTRLRSCSCGEAPWTRCASRPSSPTRPPRAPSRHPPPRISAVRLISAHSISHLLSLIRMRDRKIRFLTRSRTNRIDLVCVLGTNLCVQQCRSSVRRRRVTRRTWVPCSNRPYTTSSASSGRRTALRGRASHSSRRRSRPSRCKPQPPATPARQTPRSQSRMRSHIQYNYVRLIVMFRLISSECCAWVSITVLRIEYVAGSVQCIKDMIAGSGSRVAIILQYIRLFLMCTIYKC